MKLSAKIFLLFQLTASWCYSQNAFPKKLTDSTVVITVDQLTQVNLSADSLDELKETVDSLRTQITSALLVIENSDTVINDLWRLNVNNQEIISGKDILIQDEKKISSAYRKKFRFWKLIAVVLAGLNVYQIVR
jgi:hypothetical protein